MTDVESATSYEDFRASGRAGRRNAIHGILGSPGDLEGTELSEALAEVNISKAGNDEEGAQGQDSSSSPAKSEEAKEEGT